eukprot:g5045.t1
MEREEGEGGAQRGGAHGMEEREEQGAAIEAAAGCEDGETVTGLPGRLVGAGGMSAASDDDAEGEVAGDTVGDSGEDHAAGNGDGVDDGDGVGEAVGADHADAAPIEYPVLSLEDTIEEFCDYLVFVYDHSEAIFKKGTVFYHIKEDSEPHRVYTFGFTLDASGSLQVHSDGTSQHSVHGDDEDSTMRMAREVDWDPVSDADENANVLTLENDVAASEPSEATPDELNLGEGAVPTNTPQSARRPSSRPRYPHTARYCNQRKYVRVLPWTKKHENISGPSYDIRLNETEFRNVFSGNVSVSQLTNSILSGKIYVSPWHMQSVYNFASSFRFDRWAEYYKDLAARWAEKKAFNQIEVEAEIRAVVESTISLAIAKSISEDKTKSTAAQTDAEEKGDIDPLEVEAEAAGIVSESTSATDETPMGEVVTPATTAFTEDRTPALSLSSPIIPMLAGSFANSIEALLMHPLDLVKTRFQLATRSSVFGLSSAIPRMSKTVPPLSVARAQEMSITSQMLKIMRESDSVSSTKYSSSTNVLRLWRGSLPAVAMQVPRGALKFTMMNGVKDFFGDSHSWASVVAGAAAGTAESLLITPFELVKVRLQALDKLSVYKNSAGALLSILQKEGAFGLWRGLESTLWRNGSWNAAYFGCIGFVQQRVEMLSRRSDGEPLSAGGSILSERAKSFVAGTVGGCIGACFSTPIDVAKSRIQNTVVVGGLAKVRSTVPWTLPTVVEVGRAEGLQGLYRGFMPKLLRLGPGGGVLLLSYEWSKSVLEGLLE